MLKRMFIVFQIYDVILLLLLLNIINKRKFERVLFVLYQKYYEVTHSLLLIMSLNKGKI